jgi:hypothetical protein
VLSGLFIKLDAVDNSGWRAIFLANGDSLTLPLILQSIERGEPFHWVFSSQTFFFPDFPLYALCAFVTGSVQQALVLNAVLNVALLYGGFRWVARNFGAIRGRGRIIALAATLLFLAAALSETDVKVIAPGTVEPARIATEFLMTTYYAGVVLVALGMLGLVFWVAEQFSGRSPSRRRVTVYAIVVIVVGAATTYSNQLYLLWFVAPLGTVLVALLVWRRVTLRVLLIVLAPQMVALGIGTLFRYLFSQFIAANYEQYISRYSSADAAAMMLGVLRDWMGSPGGILRLVLVIGPLVYAVVRLIPNILRRRPLTASMSTASMFTESMSTAALFVELYVIVSTVSLVVGIIVTGQSVTRYLIPLFIFPALILLTVRPARVLQRTRPSTFVRGTATVLVVVVAVLGIAVTTPAVAALGRGLLSTRRASTIGAQAISPPVGQSPTESAISGLFEPWPSTVTARECWYRSKCRRRCTPG